MPTSSWPFRPEDIARVEVSETLPEGSWGVTTASTATGWGVLTHDSVMRAIRELQAYRNQNPPIIIDPATVGRTTASNWRLPTLEESLPTHPGGWEAVPNSMGDRLKQIINSPKKETQMAHDPHGVEMFIDYQYEDSYGYSYANPRRRILFESGAPCGYRVFDAETNWKYTEFWARMTEVVARRRRAEKYRGMLDTARYRVHQRLMAREAERRRACIGRSTWRLEDIDRYYLPQRMAEFKELAAEVVKTIKKLKAGDFEATVQVVRQGQHDFADRHGKYINERFVAKEVVDAIKAADRRFHGYHEHPRWLRSEWAKYSLIEERTEHFVHVSVEDPTQVAYYPTLEHLVKQREVRTKPGRYLTKYYPALSKERVRELANRQIAANNPAELLFKESDDPDGWVWVYEHGTGFQSCMTYNRYDRYIATGLEGQYHPVRAYARKGNGLRLAYIVDASGAVTARTIVRDGAEKGYIRVFGDDSKIFNALTAAGYGNQIGLEGVRIQRIDVSYITEEDDTVLCPYLDSIGMVDAHGDYLLITEDGEFDGQNSGGYITLEEERNKMRCEECGDRFHEDAGSWVGRPDNYWVCDSCRDESYQYVRGRHGRYCWVREDNAVQAKDGTWYDEDFLEDNDIALCAHCEEYLPLQDMHVTMDGDVCSECVVELDVPDAEGNHYAMAGCTTETHDGKTIYEDDEMLDSLTKESYHADNLAEVKWKRRTYHIHADTVTIYPEWFAYVYASETAKWYLAIVKDDPIPGSFAISTLNLTGEELANFLDDEEMDVSNAFYDQYDEDEEHEMLLVA